MNRAKSILILITLMSLDWLTSGSTARAQKQQLVILSSEVGPAVEESENGRYHLFSQDVGLLSARVYSSDSQNSWRLHLLGNKDGQPWILIRGLSTVEKQKLVTRILQANKNLDPQFSPAVIMIELPQPLPTENPVNLKLMDDTQLYGQIRLCTADTVQFVTLSGVNIAIPESQILEARWSEGKVTNGG
ncbi:MAG TPA: hypothetical protein VGA99_14485, partial [bacterium]